MFCIGTAVIFWIGMIFCAISYAFATRDNSVDGLIAARYFSKVLWRGLAVVLLVDCAWAVLMMFRIAPAWQGIPRAKWEWVDLNITLPWIGTQVLIMVGLVIYAVATDKKPKTKT